MKTELTFTDITNALSMEKGRFREWLNEGYIVPSIQEGRGIGNKAVFDQIDVLAIVLFKFFVEWKLARREASKIAMSFSRTLHTFREAAGEERLCTFLHNWGRLVIARKNGEYDITPSLVFDLQLYLDDRPESFEKFQAALGGEGAFENLAKEAKALNTFGTMGRGPSSERMFEVVITLDFRMIVEEAERVYG